MLAHRFHIVVNEYLVASNFRTMPGMVVVNQNVSRNVRGMASKAVQQTRLKSWREVPGPSSLPFFGPIHNFFPGGKLAGLSGFELWDRLYKSYGPIVKLNAVFGGYDKITLFDADAAELVYRSEEPLPYRPVLDTTDYYRTHHNPHRVVGLNGQGEEWKDLRTKVNPIMMQPKTIKVYASGMEQIANDLVAKLRLVRDENNAITKGLHVEMNKWGLEAIGLVALGTRLNCLDPDLPDDSPVREIIENVNNIFRMGEKLDINPSLWRYISTPNFKKMMHFYDEQVRLTQYFIDRASKDIEESKKKVGTSRSETPILEKLLEINVETARVMASDMFLAGIDTAALTVLGSLYLLAINPEKQKKLREELLNKPDKKPYLAACLKEARRLYPPTMGNWRLTTKEYNLLGYKIPKNVLVTIAHQYMSRMEENYPRPDEFIPERWLTDKDDPLYHGNANPFAVASFGFGVRMCIGRRIAELELETSLSKIIENFQIDWTSSEPLHLAPAILNYIVDPFHFVFKDL